MQNISQAAETVRPIELLDKKIIAGQRAPYTGILMPDVHYRDLSSCLQTLPACESSLNDSIKSGVSFGDFVVSFSLGALFGALAYVTLHH